MIHNIVDAKSIALQPDQKARVLSLAVDCLQDYALFLLDPQGYILTWNLGSKKITGYSPDEIIGKHFSMFYSVFDRNRNYPGFGLEYARKYERFEDEGWRYRQDGTKFWASVIITAISDEEGKHIGFIKVTRDLTERKRSERELVTLQRGIDSIQDYAVILLDAGGHVTKWNKGAERIKGYTAEEIIGKHFSVFYPPDVVATNFPNYELSVVRKEGRFEDEGWRMRKDGTRFWASVVITAIVDDVEGLIGFIKVTRDLTERKLAEIRAQAIRREEQEQRARALAGEQFQKNQTEFMDRVCHEIRNPLHGMYGNLNILSECVNKLKENSDCAEDLLKDMEESLAAIRECVQHQREVTDEVLTASKLESARIIAQPKDINPVEIAHSILTMYRGALEEKKVAGHLRASKNDYYVYIDPYLYKQVLINLISNAVKYTDAGSVNISVEYEDNSLIIVVQDTGRGLSQLELSKLFEKFSNTGEISAQYKPSRLGLFICKKTIEALGGTVQVTSEVGVGTQFTVRIPCEKNDLPSDKPRAVPETKPQYLEGIKVLIVEDNKVNQRIVHRMLRELHCICDVASHGKEALDLTSIRDYDIIFMDIEMPIVGGLEATRILRKQNKLMPIIGLSGFAQDKDKTAALESGMNDYLTKPFSKDDLCNLIIKYVVETELVT